MFDWSNLLGWEAVLPPNRPDLIDLAIVTTAAATTSHKSACVLGSTPEYRVSLRGMFESVVVIDKSREFKDFSDALVGDHISESFAYGDWLDILPSMPDTFDLVVSHFTHGNIEFANRSRYYEAISQALRPSGLFVDTIYQPRALLDIDDIRAGFSGRPLNLQTLNDFNAMAVFRARIIAELGCVDTSAIYVWLRTGLAHDPALKRLIDMTEARITPSGLHWDYAPEKDASSLGYGEFFEYLAEIAGDPRSAFGPCVMTLVSRRRM